MLGLAELETLTRHLVLKCLKDDLHYYKKNLLIEYSKKKLASVYL